MKHLPFGPYEKYLKRPLDCVLAVGALVVLSPVMGIIAILVRRKLGSPVFFVQERPGKDERLFKLIKFRTMSDDRDREGILLPDTERLTHFGKVLRATSIDELPELINIIKGDMSIVGPRPLATVYVPFYSEEEHRRHDVRPGLTGLAQVNGRNSISWEEKFAYDVNYVESITFIGDLRIVCKTIVGVIKKDGIGQGEEHPGSLHILRSSCENEKTDEETDVESRNN